MNTSSFPSLFFVPKNILKHLYTLSLQLTYIHTIMLYQDHAIAFLKNYLIFCLSIFNKNLSKITTFQTVDKINKCM